MVPIIPVVKTNYNFQPILVNDVATAIVKAIEIKKNEGKIYEIGGPKIINFGNMVKSILNTINKNQINIKGKTTEKLGVIGKEKAIACEVIASVIKND